ncbi:uncharacterized protein LOC142823258 [Pelodiscus sinensis]|uniref:uncharacterized protein LOC142823258 n=1 Tax=Pelodiscus sinensis TaxID=13735 RepID=UPI003F6AC54C
MKRPAPGAGAEGTETRRSLRLKWPKRCRSRRDPAPEERQTSCLWGPFCWQARPQAASPTAQQEAPPCQLSGEQATCPKPEIAGPGRSPPDETVGSHPHAPGLPKDRNCESCPAAGVPSEEAGGSKGLARAEMQEDRRDRKEEGENHAEEKGAEEEAEDSASDLPPDVDESRAGQREEEENLAVESYEESLSTEEGDAASREEEESRGEDAGPAHGGGERREEEQAGPSHRERRRSPERGAGEGEWKVLLLDKDEGEGEDED